MDIHITNRELEVLNLIANELTCLEIAKQLFLSPYTVISHKKNLMRKLGVKTIAGLVRVGCELEFVHYKKAKFTES